MQNRLLGEVKYVFLSDILIYFKLTFVKFLSKIQSLYASAVCEGAWAKRFFLLNRQAQN